MTYEQIKAVNDAMSSLTTIVGNYIATQEVLERHIQFHVDMLRAVNIPEDIVEHYTIIAKSTFDYKG